MATAGREGTNLNVNEGGTWAGGWDSEIAIEINRNRETGPGIRSEGPQERIRILTLTGITNSRVEGYGANSRWVGHFASRSCIINSLQYGSELRLFTTRAVPHSRQRLTLNYFAVDYCSDYDIHSIYAVLAILSPVCMPMRYSAHINALYDRVDRWRRTHRAPHAFVRTQY